MAQQDRDRRSPVKRRRACEQLVGDDPDRVQVRRRCCRSPDGLLGRHVDRGADDIAGRRHALGSVDRLGDPEVGDPHASVAPQQQVLGLEIAVHDPRRVGLSQACQHHLQHAAHLLV
jgi:hypothetical protein